jgi:rod shape-determining protein MreB
LAADITDRGIILTGGGALLKNMDKLLIEKTKLPIQISEDPLSTVAFGAGKVIDSSEILRKVMVD